MIRTSVTIDPEGRFKQAWDAFVLLVTVVAAIETPLRLALELPLTGGLLAALAPVSPHRKVHV